MKRLSKVLAALLALIMMIPFNAYAQVVTGIHNFSEPTWAWDESNTYAIATFNCSIHSDEQIEVRAEGDDITSSVVSEANCTTGKKIEYKATVWLNLIKYEDKKTVIVGQPLGHTKSEDFEIEPIADSTCKEEGSCNLVYHCTVCGKEFRVEKAIKTRPHTPGEAKRENVKAATCTAEGSYDEVVKCTVCGEEISKTEKTIEMAEHTPGKAKRENEVAATCTKEGSYDSVVYCTVCNEEISRTAKTIKKTAHKWSEGKCSVCNTPDEYKGYETSLDKDVYYYGEKWNSTITIKFIYANHTFEKTTTVEPTEFRTTAKDQSKLDTLNGLTFSYKGETYTLKNEIVLSPYAYCYVNYVQDYSTNKTSGKTITQTAYVSGVTEYDYQMMLNSREVTLSDKAKQYLDVDYDGSSYGKIKISVKSAAIPADSKDCYIILSGKNGSKTYKTKIIIRYRPTVSLSAKSKALSVSWGKAPAVSGYQIKYSTSSKFSSSKTVTVSNKDTTSKTISSLKSKKTYYVRVRAYKTVSGKKVYTNWSTTKKAKTK